jgi:hypothetical protein
MDSDTGDSSDDSISVEELEQDYIDAIHDMTDSQYKELVKRFDLDNNMDNREETIVEIQDRIEQDDFDTDKLYKYIDKLPRKGWTVRSESDSDDTSDDDIESIEEEILHETGNMMESLDDLKGLSKEELREIGEALELDDYEDASKTELIDMIKLHGNINRFAEQKYVAILNSILNGGSPIKSPIEQPKKVVNLDEILGNTPILEQPKQPSPARKEKTPPKRTSPVRRGKKKINIDLLEEKPAPKASPRMSPKISPKPAPKLSPIRPVSPRISPIRPVSPRLNPVPPEDKIVVPTSKENLERIQQAGLIHIKPLARVSPENLASLAPVNIVDIPKSKRLSPDKPKPEPKPKPAERQPRKKKVVNLDEIVSPEKKPKKEPSPPRREPSPKPKEKTPPKPKEPSPKPKEKTPPKPKTPPKISPPKHREVRSVRKVVDISDIFGEPKAAAPKAAVTKGKKAVNIDDLFESAPGSTAPVLIEKKRKVVDVSLLL